MSHTSYIKSVIITDLHALKSAVQELSREGVNCELLTNAKPRAYYSTQSGMGTAEVVVKLNDASYDVGIYKSDDGYEARADFYGGSVANVLGVKAGEGESAEQAKLGKLLQRYAIVATENKAMQEGYHVTRNQQENGTIQLRIAA